MLERLFCYGIWLKVSKQQIGQLQVKNIVWDVPSAELSYFIGSSTQRQGFATEAISGILRTAFKQLDFKRMFVRIIPSNEESIFLASKLGFKHEGLHRNEFRCGFGELHDVHYFSLTIEDYR
jgi:RimJ/RimL family protein N-acetyltransferase